MLSSPLLIALRVWALLLPLLASTTSADAIDDLAAKALANVGQILAGTLSDGATHNGCTKDKLLVRKEFGILSKDERAAYIKAVQCLSSKPAKSSASVAPGAKTRYDDWVVTHIQQTMNIHGTASFLSWHRYFTWNYENALRTECGYNGSQPYWDWRKYNTISTSPMFNGDDYSMSGNGAKVQHGGSGLGAAGVQVPAGDGGGCVTSGPFKNFTVNLGPVSPATAVTIPKNPRSDGLGYNPRCLHRDMSDYFIKSGTLTTSNVLSLLQQPTSVGPFQDKMQGDTPQAFGVHSAGHFTIWGDPGGDFYTSPGDPAFWLHHGMIDRAWWIWQNQDPKARVMTVAGGTSMFGGKAGTLDDAIDQSIIGGSKKIRDLVSTTAGPFCYVYDDLPK